MQKEPSTLCQWAGLFLLAAGLVSAGAFRLWHAPGAEAAMLFFAVIGTGIFLCGRPQPKRMALVLLPATAVITWMGMTLLMTNDHKPSFQRHVTHKRYNGPPGRLAESPTASVRGQDCGLPAVEKGEKVVSLYAGQGAIMSTHAFRGTRDFTRAASVTVASDDSDVYLVLENKMPLIWTLQGLTERVSRVILTGKQPAGVTGIDAGKVTFAQADCRLPPPSSPRFGVSVEMGHEFIVASNHVQSAMPVSKMTFGAPKGYNRLLWMHAYRESRGIAQFNDSEIVSKEPVEPLAVMPGALGIAKLEAEGYLQIMKGTTDLALIVTKPFDAFPAGLDKSIFAFVFPENIPLPANAREGACAISLETGRKMSGNCDGDTFERVRRVLFSPPVGDTSGDRRPAGSAGSARVAKPACRLPPAQAGEQVVFLGGASGAARSNYSVKAKPGQRPMTQADAEMSATGVAGIKIGEGDAPLYIVASSSNPVIWRLAGQVSRVSRLVIGGAPDKATREIKAGATGIDGGKISFFDIGCLPMGAFAAGSTGFLQAPSVLRALTGKRPEIIVSAPGSAHWFEIDKDAARHVAPPSLSSNGPHGIMRISVTQLPIEPPPGWNRLKWIELLMRFPAGLADLTGEKIVSRVDFVPEEPRKDEEIRFVLGSETQLPSVAGKGLWAALMDSLGTLVMIVWGFKIPLCLFFLTVVLLKAISLSRRLKKSYLETARWLLAAEVSSLVPSLFLAAVITILAGWGFSYIMHFGLPVRLAVGALFAIVTIRFMSRLSSFIEGKVLSYGLRLEEGAAIEAAGTMNSKVLVTILGIVAVLGLIFYLLAETDKERSRGKPMPTFRGLAPAPQLDQR